MNAIQELQEKQADWLLQETERDLRIAEKILEEDTLWIAKQMLGNAAERKIIFQSQNTRKKN